MQGSGARWWAIGLVGLAAVLFVLLAVPPLREQVLVSTGWRAPGTTDIAEFCANAQVASPEWRNPSVQDARRVEVGHSIQEAVNEVGPGGTVIVAAGVHASQSVVPLDGQTILGEPGAVLSGRGQPYAFRSSAEDVTISGLVIEGYLPDQKSGVIHGEVGATGWTVSFNEVRFNGEIGIVAKGGWNVVENSVHHNGRYGITGSGSKLRVEDNEIACNALEFGSTSESAATKFVHTSSLVLARNHVFYNFGNGLWVDINNVEALISANTVEHNALAGIFIEISCGGLIENNDVIGNGFGTKRPRGMHNAGIFVANSPNVEVAGNRLKDNAKGIGGLHWEHGNRQAVDRCVPELRSLFVHGNEIEQENGLVAGIDATIDRPQVWLEWGNVFSDNEYRIGDDARFRWSGSTLDLLAWNERGGG